MSGTVTGAADVSQEIANDLIMVSEASGEMGAVSTEVSAQASGLDTISQELKQLIEHFHLTSETRVAGV